MGRKGGREVKQGANNVNGNLRRNPPQKPSAETSVVLWYYSIIILNQLSCEDHGAASLSRFIRWFPLVRLARLLIPAQALRRNPPQKPSAETLRRNLRRNPPQKPPQKPPAETSNFVFNSNKYSILIRLRFEV